MMPNKLFSRVEENKHIIYRILGIKFSVKNSKFYKQFKDAIKIQDAYDLTELKNTKKLILFLIPSPDSAMINGGIMSIFSLCEESRRINEDALCIISTPPHCKYTYAKNDKFLNNENIYRFSQVVDNANNLDEMILHIPEYSAGNFYNTLSEKDIEFLKSIKNLHINIMNQNIELMPEPEKNNMTFTEYMDLISRAFFTITFGEGMDGYFIQPQFVNSMGFAVYNDDFFPSNKWQNLKNIYLSYDEMYENIVSDIKRYSRNKKEYVEIVTKLFNTHSDMYQRSKFKDNLKNFYIKKYDYLPRAEINEK